MWRQNVQRRRLVRDFFEGLRSRRYGGPGFEVKFDVDLMQMAREDLQPEDVPHLLAMIENDTLSSGLRNRAASLILSEQCFSQARERAAVVRTLNDLYVQNVTTWHWEVLRGIALALSNRAADHQSLLSYLKTFITDEYALQANLRQSENYYGTAATATQRFLSRVKDADAPIGSVLWEAFYLAYRHGPAEPAVQREILSALRSRAATIEDDDLRTLWRSLVANVETGDR